MANSVFDIVQNRSGNRCERCKVFLRRNRPGKPRRLDGRSLHHRRKRSNGGKDSVYCLVVLCERCHRDVHADEEAAALEGWIVRRDPRSAPFLGWRGWVLPTAEGGLTLWDFAGGRTTPVPLGQPRARPVRRSSRPPRKVPWVA